MQNEKLYSFTGTFVRWFPVMLPRVWLWQSAACTFCVFPTVWLWLCEWQSAELFSMKMLKQVKWYLCAYYVGFYRWWAAGGGSDLCKACRTLQVSPDSTPKLKHEDPSHICSHLWICSLMGSYFFFFFCMMNPHQGPSVISAEHDDAQLWLIIHNVNIHRTDRFS